MAQAGEPAAHIHPAGPSQSLRPDARDAAVDELLRLHEDCPAPFRIRRVKSCFVFPPHLRGDAAIRVRLQALQATVIVAGGCADQSMTRTPDPDEALDVHD